VKNKNTINKLKQSKAFFTFDFHPRNIRKRKQFLLLHILFTSRTSLQTEQIISRENYLATQNFLETGKEDDPDKVNKKSQENSIVFLIRMSQVLNLFFILI